MMRSKTNKDENIQNYLKETLLLVFVLFLLVSLKQHLSGECFAAQTAASQDNRKEWNTKLSGNHSCKQNVATHRTQRLYATRTHKLLAALPLETYTPN
jgi:hypothetical protein